MQLTSSHPRTRPIAAGHLRAFEAVARHLNFRAAAEELSLTQSAVSRQIQALEDEVGVPSSCATRARSSSPARARNCCCASSMALPRIDATVRQIRQSAGARAWGMTTFASFASMWLIPRLEAFQRDHPDIDIRIDATDNAVDLARSDVDLALRYAVPQAMPADAQCACSANTSRRWPAPGCIKSNPPIQKH
jgi:LysR family glycine cleavage system transcriptional activator